MAFACKICIWTKGLMGSDVASLPQTSDEELFEHIEKVHHMPVRRDGETAQEAEKRFLVKYPEAKTCPECIKIGTSWTQVTGDAPPKMSKEVNMGTRFWYEEQTSRYLSETLSEIKALEGQMTMMSEKLARLQDVAKAFETALRTIKEEQERR